MFFKSTMDIERLTVQLMKKKCIALTISLLLLILCLSGCELLEEEDNYITVNITAYAQVVLINEKNQPLQLIPGVTVHFDMIKAGGERLQFDEIAESGQTAFVYGSFHLYKEQDIEIIATPNLESKLFEQPFPSYVQLNWADVYPAIDFGGSFGWTPVLVIELKNSSVGGGI